jgi:RimJ/RimL family protein N-acetyltransferase
MSVQYRDYLVPSHHGRGIMTDAVDTIINDLGRPYLGVRHIVVTTFVGNEASMKVFLKNSFVFTHQLVDHVETKGKMQSLNVLERHFLEEVEVNK